MANGKKEYGQHQDPHSKAKYFLRFAWDKVQQSYLEEKSADEKIYKQVTVKNAKILYDLSTYTPGIEYRHLGYTHRVGMG